VPDPDYASGLGGAGLFCSRRMRLRQERSRDGGGDLAALAPIGMTLDAAGASGSLIT